MHRDALLPANISCNCKLVAMIIGNKLAESRSRNGPAGEWRYQTGQFGEAVARRIEGICDALRSNGATMTSTVPCRSEQAVR